MEPNQETKPSCAINGVFVVGRSMGVCARHGGENKCYETGPCEFKVEAPEETQDVDVA